MSIQEKNNRTSVLTYLEPHSVILIELFIAVWEKYSLQSKKNIHCSLREIFTAVWETKEARGLSGSETVIAAGPALMIRLLIKRDNCYQYKTVFVNTQHSVHQPGVQLHFKGQSWPTSQEWQYQPQGNSTPSNIQSSRSSNISSWHEHSITPVRFCSESNHVIKPLSSFSFSSNSKWKINIFFLESFCNVKSFPDYFHFSNQQTFIAG